MDELCSNKFEEDIHVYETTMMCHVFSAHLYYK